MLADIIIALSTLVTLLGILDFVLSDQQKKSISEATLRLWNWLDDLRRLPFLDWLRNRKAQMMFGLGAICLNMASAAYLAFIVISSNDSYYHKADRFYGNIGGFLTSFIIIIIIMSPAVLIGVRFASFILNISSPFRHLCRGVLTLLGAIVLSATTIFGMSLTFMQESSSMLEDVLSGFSLLILVPICFVVWSFWAIVFVPLLAIYSAQGVLAVVEFVLRRIAEQAKGPILAVSALIGLVGALLKAVV